MSIKYVRTTDTKTKRKEFWLSNYEYIDGSDLMAKFTKGMGTDRATVIEPQELINFLYLREKVWREYKAENKNVEGCNREKK